MFDKILMLADSDDPNQPALRRALQCAHDASELEVLAVVYEPALEGYLGNTAIYEPLRSRVLNERRERAAGLARAAEGWGVRATGRAVWGHPLHRIVADEIAARGIELVVATPSELAQSHGESPSGLSHSAWQLVKGCSVPVLIVKSDGQAKYRNIVAAVDPFHAHAKPAALDTEILRHAKHLQSLTGGQLTVLYCYTPLDYFGADLSESLVADEQIADGREAALQALCRDAGVSTKAARLVAGAPQAVLEGLQKSGEADLIVMGALARGRFAEVIVGSTAERVLHHGRGDVLVVKSPSLG
jgi:nucleotide-binding universal stress UspA family protein